ncbi:MULTISPECIES: acetyl-CoA decarbonylase/synthase complex subunit delta [Carboxydocella]|uniref:Acetyl-CoA decarbonylase/synthase delta subunit n=2 Tax=Carboxydocella TaxID=178898 RepID=A0A1T4QRJ2_9FIRM|nr:MULTISPECIES: acetyl-CoA decarbonylase/synthase complex subunit delta [Carboxydocella]AVX20837.1 Corrinoid iron-sulfur protein small subunit [Carboxydocella thermautotrophica]AVX31256.1 Corrinoid iron-sulfur protein small subunit [Carboxydocella thermautotrophica]SKA06350.1 acetyl-CoA decarbonylase/synthase delta subunit [Carboxydocella sporoproducens DSM 16521]GAW29993.1 acetyl-CoA decarbonylase/synthase complex subunit delta [Carboxydocella sp. ULO1]GAW30404.1 acetyl-CoA decarbonylase/syn
MAVTILKERWTSKVAEVTIGEGPKAVKVGGDSTLPYLTFEGQVPNAPVVALEVSDVYPEDWPEILKNAWGDVLSDPVAWAKKAVEFGADAVALRLDSAHPDKGNASAEDVARTAKAVADAIDVPLIVLGCGVEEKDAEIFPTVGEVLQGKNCLIGCATQENYNSIVATALVNGHSVIASSPLDINLAKQLNILITEMNLPSDRIVIDPLIGALGYGIEYAYSIMERARLGALTGDKMLAMPIICFVGQESWKAKEAKDEGSPEGYDWGGQYTRAILWEVMTATTLLQAGGHLFLMRHPDSLKQFKDHVAAISKGAQY